MNKKRDLKLSLKISLILGSIIFLSIFIYLVIYIHNSKEYESKVLGKENIAMLHSIDSSLTTIVENANNYSKLILADSAVQKQMKSGNIVTDFNKQQLLISQIYSITQFSESIDTVWLIDQNEQQLTVGKSADFSIKENTTEYNWIKKLNGKAKLLTKKCNNQNCFVLVRAFKDLNEFRTIGIIGVQIDNDKLQSLIHQSLISENEKIIILNEDNEIICSVGNFDESMKISEISQELDNSGGEVIHRERIGGKYYYLSGIVNKGKQWKIIRYSPVLKTEIYSNAFRFNIILIVGLGLLIICISLIFARCLTVPVQALLDKMKSIEHGEPEKIVEKAYLSEFRQLFNGYNKMVDEIKRLLQDTIVKQKRIRIVEMNEMQELMKPHFLYNTLESLEALILMEETEKSAKLVRCLGQFYRKSVSGGREFVTINEEIQIVKDYADILKIRFGECFKFDVRLDEAYGHYKIPKLTIQPLVENSFQHGIRMQEKYGYIQICVEMEENNLHISVKDNGKGIPDDIINEIEEGKIPDEKRSLGLRGTIQRLKVIYEDGFTYKICNENLSEIHIYINRSALGEEKKNEKTEGNCH
ncbi:MAG: histidine kinase [Blautia sp.]|nr:histidine kinase [Blautia sp.]